MKKLGVLFCLALFLGTSACKEEDPCIDESKINPESACTMEWRPVCGCNGVTYGNDCQATNAGLLHWTEGECQ